MKIAAYNVWYPNISVRAEQLINEINNLDADIIGLQEVPPIFYERLVNDTKYSHRTYIQVNEENGLALLSKYSFSKHFSFVDNNDFANSIAHNVVLEADGVRFSVTNVHLPWDSIIEKEKQIVAIDRFIHFQKNEVHFFILLGDFNTTLNSSVHHYLLGDQSLLGYEAKPYWNDLASAHAELNGYDNIPTLDFVNNPRWRGENTNYVPDTCDRIYIMESFNWNYAFKPCNIDVFGKEISLETGYAPSDHYGLLAEVTFTV